MSLNSTEMKNISSVFPLSNTLMFLSISAHTIRSLEVPTVITLAVGILAPQFQDTRQDLLYTLLRGPPGL